MAAILSVFAQNKVRPKDADSNLSYLLSHALFGLALVFTAAKLGDDSLFDTPPQNNYFRSTDKQSSKTSKMIIFNLFNLRPLINV